MKMGKPANYEIVEAESSSIILVIRDIGPWDVHFTITNDVENVVEALHSAGQLPRGRRLWYYDSEGCLDELLVKNGRYAGFIHLKRIPKRKKVE